MADEIRMTPAAVRALLSGDLDNALVAMTPGGIEAQEARGQRDFVNSTMLPRKFNCCSKKQFEQMGIVFSGPIDDLFCEAVLPAGWHKKPTDHSMWSDLVDAKGRKRASIFYKAAFYDRDAFLSICQRYTVSVEPIMGWNNYSFTDPCLWCCVVDDGGFPVWTLDVIGPEPTDDANRETQLAWYDTKDECAKIGQQWLDANYPDWRDPTAYWD